MERMKEIHVRQDAHGWRATADGCEGEWATSKWEAVGSLVYVNQEEFGIVIVQHPKQCTCEGCKGRAGR